MGGLAGFVGGSQGTPQKNYSSNPAQGMSASQMKEMAQEKIGKVTQNITGVLGNLGSQIMGGSESKA